MISAAFEHELFRFGTSGTLIAIFGLADHLARRRSRGVLPRRPRWLGLFFFTFVLAFYLLIEPTGGPLLAGWGNVAGIAAALLAAWTRFRQPASGSRRDLAGPGREPSLTRGIAGLRGGSASELSSRLAFYAALPAAVGVPWGWLVLTLPAWLASLYYATRVAGEPLPAVVAQKRS